VVKNCWRSLALSSIPLLLLLAEGCAPNMSDQPRYNPLAPSDFFPDGRSERPPVVGTVPHGSPGINDPFYTGRADGKVVERMPVPVTRSLLERGRERFDIYCSPCHGRTGDGEGMIVKRGFRAPPSYHIQRLLDAPDGHFFEVITNGFGEMASYAYRVAPADRWAIIAYIRALQFSQHARLEDVPAAERRKLQGAER
jgi:mono/diheme cytochrome c family protein